MGTEILWPQDCLIERIRLPSSSFPWRNNSYHYGVPNPNPNLIPMKQQHHHHMSNCISTHGSSRKSATMSRRSGSGASSDDLRGLKAEKVTILRRAEPLSKMKKAKSYGGLARMENSDMYAGSAFAVSPEPSALPFPSFQRKKKQPSRSFDDSATRDLRRLLGLE